MGSRSTIVVLALGGGISCGGVYHKMAAVSPPPGDPCLLISSSRLPPPKLRAMHLDESRILPASRRLTGPRQYSEAYTAHLCPVLSAPEVTCSLHQLLVLVLLHLELSLSLDGEKQHLCPSGTGCSSNEWLRAWLILHLLLLSKLICSRSLVHAFAERISRCARRTLDGGLIRSTGNASDWGE